MNEGPLKEPLLTMRIWKFPIGIVDLQNLLMPEGAEILTAQVQEGGLFLWALVNPAAPAQRRVIEILGTGFEIADAERKHIATAQMADGSLVWHVFERL